MKSDQENFLSEIGLLNAEASVELAITVLP